MRRLTRQELARHTGQDGTSAYVACLGVVYDVTGSFLWQGGRHQALHSAGEDLSVSLDEAPHGIDLLKGFPVVGILDDQEEVPDEAAEPLPE